MGTEPVHDCRMSERHDVAAELTIEYAIEQVCLFVFIFHQICCCEDVIECFCGLYTGTTTECFRQVSVHVMV